jgi:hypothetical protein
MDEHPTIGIGIFGAVKSHFEDSRWSGYFSFVSTFLLFFFINHQYVSQSLNLPQWVVVEIKTDAPIQLQVYYDMGDGYGEKDKRIQLVSGNNDFQRIKIRVPNKPLHSFRIDPLTNPGVVYIKSITIESLWARSHSWPAERIVKDFRPQNDIIQFQLENDAVKIRSVGIDPYFGLISSIPRINEISDGWIILILFVFSLLCLLSYKILVLMKEYWKKMGHGIYLRTFKISFVLMGVLLPCFLAIHFVRENSVNIPIWDQWEFVPLLSAFLERKPWIQLLIDFHNEHRIILPRVIFLVLAVITQWNVATEMYVNLFFVGILLVVLSKLLKETGGHLFLMVPVSWLLFSLQQWENLLWGWQIAISMMLTASVVSIFCLSRVRRNRYYTISAFISGVFASFSFMGGLCIWPVGLLQLLIMRARKSTCLTWFIGGALTIVFYFMGYRKPVDTPDVFIFLKNPVDFMKYIFAYLGSALSGDSFRQSLVYGALVVLLFIFAIVIQRLRMKQWKNVVPWVMIGLFSLLCGGMMGIGRLGYGIDQALSSRYISFSSLFLISTMILSVGAMVDLNQRRKNLTVIVLLVINMILSSGYINSYLSGEREGYYRKLVIGQFSRSLYHLENANDIELKMIYWDVKVLKDRAAILRHLEIGPYAITPKPVGDASR